MHKIFTGLFLISFITPGFGQLKYNLDYSDTSNKMLTIKIESSKPFATPVSFIMPRSIPGRYSGINYFHYIMNLKGKDIDGQIVALKNEGPRWSANQSGIISLSYQVDLEKMEKEEHSLSDLSFIRSGYAGLLNYSVFGFIEGVENDSLTCTIKTLTDWPIFSTISPKELMNKGLYSFHCKNYYQLADGQTLIGKALRVKQFKGRVPVFIANYSEGEKENLDNLGWQTVKSLDILFDYFKIVPFTTYTHIKQTIIPITSKREDFFAMEHFNSTTALGDTRFAIPQTLDTTTLYNRMFGILHHMAHAYIPLKSYGDNYKPHVLEVPPLIKNIWFNEGFIWFLCSDILHNKRIDSILESGIKNEPPAVKKLGLFNLSLLASLQYGEDFRIAKGIFSRGAMMAKEMNQSIKLKTGGKKSMKDVFRYLISWSEKHNGPFTLEEFPKLIHTATGVDLSGIYSKWLLPLNASPPTD